MAAGVVRLRLRAFAFFASIAVLAWAIYAGLLGYWGSVVFRDEPGKATLFGIALGMVLGMAAEAVRRLLARRSAKWAKYDGTSTSTPVATSWNVAEESFPR